MRKLLATVICWFLAFGLGFTFIPPSFDLLIGWLGPVFGTSLRLVLSTIFLLFADPLIYKTLIIIWAAVGFIGGLIIRKRIGSVLSMLPVYTGQFLIVGLSGFHIFDIIQKTGILQQFSIEKILTLFPPVPRGLSFNTLLNVPIAAEIVPKLPTSIESLTTDMVINILLGTVVLNIVKNIVIVCVSALVGCEVGKLIGKVLRPKMKGSDVETAEVRVKSQTKNLKKTMLTVVLLILTSSTSFVLPLMVGQTASAVFTWYQENIFGAVDDDGTAYVGSLFYDTAQPLHGISLTNDAFTGAITAVLISQETTAATLPSLISSLAGNITSYYNLLTPTMFIIAYADVDLAVARGRADSAASIFSTAFQTSITPISGVPPITQTVEGHTFTAFVYQAGTPFSSMANLIMGCLPTYRGGIALFVNETYKAGLLIPELGEMSADGSAMFVGFLRPSDVSGLIREVPTDWQGFAELFLPDTATPVGVMGAESYWLNAYHSSSFEFNFSINDLLGIKEPIKFSPQANVSTALLLAPNATINVSGIPVPVAPIVKLITTASITPQILTIIQGLTSGSEILGVTVDLKTGVITNKETGEVVDLVEALKTAFVAIMPMEIKVEKTLSVSEIDPNGEIVVTIKVTNMHATEPAKNVRLDDSLSLTFYPFSASVQGDLIKEWPEIASGSSVTHTYKISLSKEGIYTFPFALVWYDYTGKSFFARSDSVEARVRSPSFLQVLAIGIPYAWNLAVGALNMLPVVGGNGQMVLMGIVVVVVGAIAFNEYWGYRKRKKKGEKS